ncbi:AAA family ATPase [Mobiluncus mulieris]|uniref:AAA family ATPase n=1 Tax=Mobiluncus mulieris TaxID=2052 RepID=UPI000DD6CC86
MRVRATTILRWRQKGLDGVFSGERLSSGTLRFICLTVLLQQTNPPETIVLDEPELGLHPFAIYHSRRCCTSLPARRGSLLSPRNQSRWQISSRWKNSPGYSGKRRDCGESSRTRGLHAMAG